MGKLGTKVIAVSMFIIGVATGFFIYAGFQEKIEVLAPAAIMMAILTWFGSGTDFIKLLRDWVKEKNEEEKKIAIRLLIFRILRGSLRLHENPKNVFSGELLKGFVIEDLFKVNI
jgi:hypothetical protein